MYCWILFAKILLRIFASMFISDQFSSVQSLNRVQLFATPWNRTCQPSLSITNSRTSLKLMSIESVMPSNHLILCHPLLLLPSIFPSIRVFSNDLALRIRWPKYWSIRDYYEKLYGNKMDNLEEMDRFLEKFNLQEWTRKKSKLWTTQLQSLKLKLQ